MILLECDCRPFPELAEQLCVCRFCHLVLNEGAELWKVPALKLRLYHQLKLWVLYSKATQTNTIVHRVVGYY